MWEEKKNDNNNGRMNGKKEAKWICLVYSPNAFVSVFVEVNMRN